MSKQFKRAKIFSTHDTETGYPHRKEWSWSLISHQLKMDQIPKCKSQNYKILEKYIGVNLCDLGLGHSFLDMTLIAHTYTHNTKNTKEK